MAVVFAQGPQPQRATASLTTGFTYQGQLRSSGASVNGSCNIAFRLYDAAIRGNVIGTAMTPTIPITNGLFTTLLDFGPGAFNGDARWLDIQVGCPAGSGIFTTLSRQPLTATPYALFASNASLLAGQDSSAFVNISGAQTISGVKTFSGGVKFPDGTTQTTAYYRRVLPGPGAAATVDSAAIVGAFSSITIGADGLGLVSYYDALNATLKVLHCANAACSSGNISTTVDSGGVGQFTSITIGADGLGLISYYDQTNSDLKVLHCGNAACSGGNTVDSLGLVGRYTSITICADGLGLISYYDSTNKDLKVLHCGNAACSSGNTAIHADSAGDNADTSITIGADGLGLVSYRDVSNAALKVLHCGNAACSSGDTAATVDSVGNGVLFTSITIGADGLGLVSYHDDPNFTLKVLHCGNAACSSGNISTTVDSVGFVGQFNSITIGADGLGLISYFDDNNNALKVFRCSNLTCTPYTRVGR